MRTRAQEDRERERESEPREPVGRKASYDVVTSGVQRLCLQRSDTRQPRNEPHDYWSIVTGMAGYADTLIR